MKPALLFLIAALGLSRAQTPAIAWRAGETPPAVEVTGLPLETLRGLPADALVVFAEQRGPGAVPAMAGATRVAEGRLRFEPRFPLARGVRYRAEFRAPGAAPLVAFFELPADRAAPTTLVRQIYPSAGELPENQLKFYVHFSAPMSRGGTYEHVQILDASGAPIELPFLELDEELWDPSMTRLTLLIDPGRIKRGVKPLEDIGPVFEAGKRYTLVVGARCRDALGRPLQAGFRKEIRVAAADRTPPDPTRWKIRAPAAGTREPLVVDFDEPMDHALALRLITVTAKAGGSVAGEPTLAEHERRWNFVPAQPWTRGRHALAIATTIEDLAGNNIGKTFDVDLFEGPQRRMDTRSVQVGFEVK